MTDLQTSLFIIGGAFLVGVISYNKWQEYKAKKSVERAFSGSHDDVLMTPGKAAGKDSGEAPPRHEPKLFETEPDADALPRDDLEQIRAFAFTVSIVAPNSRQSNRSSAIRRRRRRCARTCR